MANKLRAYSDSVTLTDFKEDLLNYPQYVDTAFFNPESRAIALRNLNNMTESQEKQFLSYLVCLDQTMSMPGAANANRFHKIPTALAGCIYLVTFPEAVADLTNDELCVLAKSAITESTSDYVELKEKIGKELLSIIVSRGEDHMYRSEFLDLAIDMLDGGATKSTVASFMKKTPLASLKQQAHDHIAQKIEEAYKYL